MVLPMFVQQALLNEPLTVYGDGTQSRCFCAVSDVVEGLINLPNQPRAAGKVVNLGSNEEISILDLAKRVVESCESQSEVRVIPYDEAYGPGFDDMLRRVPDISRARELIGWEPLLGLQDIIRDTRDHFS